MDDRVACWSTTLGLAVMLSTACQNSTIVLETDSNESDEQPTSSSSTTSAGPSPTADPDDTGIGASTRQVDILFVVDNSGSMGEEQGKMAASIGRLTGILEDLTPPIDYRIGVTTTDNGNPYCGTTGPEAGALRASSCRSRASEFIFNGNEMIDATQEACLDHCSLEVLDLGGDRWVERSNSTGTGNVAPEAFEETLRCMLPQGIDGCGFESHLESTWKTLRRSATEGDAAFGFLRPGALTAIVVVTDEVDCSYNSDWDTIFRPEGNRVFWSDPDAILPSSAVCWNAGVACSGGGGGVYDECFAIDLDENANQVDPANADEDAVLRPLSRYTDLLDEFTTFMVLIGGVNTDGTITYADSLDDTQFQADFGIGPGCSSMASRAVPPVRLREVVEQVSGPGNLHSICDSDYTAAFESLAEGIFNRLP
ncbi:MAG: hypothetical protein AAGF11_43215 [Myxococcota bacterium]